MSTSPESGVINLASPYSVDDTMQRLVRVLGERGGEVREILKFGALTFSVRLHQIGPFATIPRRHAQ